MRKPADKAAAGRAGSAAGRRHAASSAGLRLGGRIYPLLLALLAVHCGDDRLAGGYDDVENPALTVTLRTTDGRAFGPGEVSLYARYQSPARDSLPLLTRSLASGTLRISDSAVLAAMDSARLRGTPWHSRDTVEFNLVATEPAGASPLAEAYAGDFLLVRVGASGYAFRQRRGGSVLYPDGKGSLAAAPTMASPVLRLRGQVGPKGLDIGLKTVFVPGTPYAAEVAGDGSFELARIAGGRYELKALSLDDKVYSAADSLITSESYSASDWSEADVIWIE